MNFEAFFQRDEIEKKHFAFYKGRKDYYGKYYGFSDVVFGLVRYLQANPGKVPKYGQVLIDEFQDFNRIEVTLVELLAQASPMLIAGDDDQSLYTDLKNASPDYIREKHGDNSPEYTPFSLPFCSRCTRVIVDATNDVVVNARKNGLLQKRVDKPYVYFPCEAKDQESDDNRHIVYTQQYQAEMPLFILKEIARIGKSERRPFSVLIVVPPQLKSKSVPYLAAKLKQKGFRKVTTAGPSSEKTPTQLEGLKLLLQDKDDNLGWRIIAQHHLPLEEFSTLLKKTADGTKTIASLMSTAQRAKVKKLLSTLRQVRDEKEVEAEELQELLAATGHRPLELASTVLRDDIASDIASEYDCPRAIRDIPVTIATIPGSKGLAGDYVFITHFDHQYYSQDHKGELADKDVFNFLVALTRAKKKAYLVSSKDTKPALLKWVDGTRIQEQLDAPHQKARA